MCPKNPEKQKRQLRINNSEQSRLRRGKSAEAGEDQGLGHNIVKFEYKNGLFKMMKQS